MKIGVPKEIKTNENRIALVPAGAEALVAAGHDVMIEKGAGEGSGFTDAAYTGVGATVGPDADAVWREAEMIMKVKEPIAKEWPRMRRGQVIFTYFHFAADEKLTKAHLDSGAVCIAYETVELPSRELPLLTPMSEVAGRMAVQEGAKYLEKLYGGRGVLLGGVPGVPPAKVVILGGGIVGINAAKMAAGMGAKVTVLDLSLERLRYLSDVMPANVTLIYSNRHNILEQISTADLVVGAVLIPGAVAPRLIRREDLKTMQPGAVIVDVAIDQGGCVETIKATTHENPTYVVDGIIHYGVANMPGGVPRTSTLALTNATFPYAMQLANKGWKQALKENAALKKGLNVV
ncbi:MAG TPA: alanine dehydrogenase, partial [Gemmatimonadaceae bacterium]|nr:alanine dehydrogenase [Gemmatimonadaceae bacterium]